MADFYSSIFQTIKPLDPVDYLFKEQEARLKEAENKRQQEELEFNRRQQARADEYLKVAKSQDERNLEKYQREIEANRSIGNLYKEYQKTNKPLDMYGQFGQDLQSTLIDKGLTKEAIRIAEKRAEKFERDADDAARYSQQVALENLRQSGRAKKEDRLKIRSFPDTNGDKVQYQVDSNGNPVNVWDPERLGWKPIAAKLQEEQQQAQPSVWGDFFEGVKDSIGLGSPQAQNSQVSSNVAQSVADIQRLVRNGEINSDQEARLIEELDRNNQAAPVNVPQADRGSFDPWSVITAPAAGIDQFLGSQLGGASHFIGDAIGKTGLFPETAQAINQFGDIQEGFGNSAKKRFGVDTGAENLLSDLTGAGAGIAKQVGTYTLGGPLAVAGAMFPEIKNTAMQIANAGGGPLEQARGAATQGLIDTLGGSLASKYIKGTGWLGGALAEGTTEGLQELASIGLVDNTTALPDPTAREAGQRVSYNTLLGMFGGGVAGSLGGRSRSGGDIDPSIPEGLAAGDVGEPPINSPAGAKDTSKIVVDGIPIQDAIGFTERLGLPYSTKITPDDVYYQGGPDQPQLFLPAPEVKPIGKRSQLSAPTAEEVLTPIRRPWEHSGEPILIRDGIQSLSDSYQTSEGLYIPSQAEVELYRESDDGKILTELPQVLKPTADVIQDVSKIGDLSDYYEPKPVGTFEQSLATGGDILPSKIGGFDFSGNKISKGGILTPEVKLDTQVGPRIATDPTGFELRIPLSEKGVTTRAEIDTFFKGRFGSQRGAVRLTQQVDSTNLGKVVKERQLNKEDATWLNVDRYFHTSKQFEGVDAALNKLTQNFTYLTTANQIWQDGILDPTRSEYDRYIDSRALKAGQAINNHNDVFHGHLTPLANKVAEFARYDEPVRAVVAKAIQQAQIAKSTQPNFNSDTFYQNYKVPVGKNQFRNLTEKEIQAISSHKAVTDLVADQIIETQVFEKKKTLNIERSKIANALKAVSPRVPTLDMLRIKGKELPADITRQESVAMHLLQQYDIGKAEKLKSYAAELNKLREELKGSPYSPLMRQGKYAVVVTDKDNRQLYFSLKENLGEQKKLEASLKKIYPDYNVKRYEIKDPASVDRISTELGGVNSAIAKAEGLVNFNALLEQAKATLPSGTYDPADLHDISKEIQTTLGALRNEINVNGQGMMTHLLPADNIVKVRNKISGQEEYVPLPGYEEDPAKALMKYVTKAAYFNARLKTSAEARSHIEALPRSSDSRGFLLERLNEQLGTPTDKDRYISGIQQAHVLATLGLRPSSAISSAVGISLVTVPNLSFVNRLRRKNKLSLISPEKTFADAARLAFSSGVNGDEKIIAKYLKSNNPKHARLGVALKKAKEQGIFGFDASKEWEGLAWQEKSTTQKVTEKAMFLFSMSEHFANRTSFISHFNALDGMFTNIDEQYEAAKNYMRSMNPYNTKGNRPVFSRGLGRIPTSFRLYNGLQLRAWRNWFSAARKGDPDGTAAVARAFGYMLSAVGVLGVPFAQEAIQVARAFGYDPKEKLKEATNEFVSDSAYWGLLANSADALGIPAFTFSGSLATDIIPDIQASERLSTQDNARITTGNLLGGSYNRYWDSVDGLWKLSPWNRDRDVYQGTKQLVGTSAAAGSIWKGVEDASKGKLTNKKGKVLTDERGQPVKLNPVELGMEMVGLNPLKKAKASQRDYEKYLKKGKR